MVQLHSFDLGDTIISHTSSGIQKARPRIFSPPSPSAKRPRLFFQMPSIAALPSPISKLPVELLSCIFMHSSESNTDECLPFDSSTVRTPLILSCVCKHWRNVARNTPRLWARICITSELLVDNDSLDHFSHVLTCLSLSRHCPLDILIDARDEDWDFSEPE